MQGLTAENSDWSIIPHILPPDFFLDSNIYLESINCNPQWEISFFFLLLITCAPNGFGIHKLTLAIFIGQKYQLLCDIKNGFITKKFFKFWLQGAYTILGFLSNANRNVFTVCYCIIEKTIHTFFFLTVWVWYTCESAFRHKVRSV